MPVLCLYVVVMIQGPAENSYSVVAYRQAVRVRKECRVAQAQPDCRVFS